MNNLHIAEIDFAEFFAPAFPSPGAARAFVSCVEEIPREESKAKIVLHQSARMIWLADRIEENARGRPALLILFYIIAAEAVAKMVTGFEGEGESKRHVRLFFEEICSDRHRARLERAFWVIPGRRSLPLREVVDLLYKVRCDVVHEGMYFTFMLPEPSNGFPMITGHDELSLETSFHARDLRQIVLEGAVLGAVRLIRDGSSCKGHIPNL